MNHAHLNWAFVIMTLPTSVVKRHFTTKYTYPNPYPRSVAATTYSKCYVPNLVRKSFHARSSSSDVKVVH